ncbi:MAG TPA: SRPBCC family protein [Dermatophilaceae bacterium]|jgi:hypothetical protein
MATFTIERVVAAPPAKVWEIITDWAGYARWMPLTTMRLDPGPTRVGWSFAGLTSVGRLLVPLTDRINRALFARVVDAMAAEAVRASAQDASAQDAPGQPDPGRR